MKILNLKLVDVRNHENLEIDFDENLTMITGRNGSGKSTILESVHALSTGRAKSSRYDKDLIQYGKDFCTINADIETKDDTFNMELQIIRSEKFENASIKKAKINKVVKSIQYFTGIFNSVLFSPQDIQLITGSPSERRRYMDDMLSQTDKDYKKSLNDYVKAVRHRNKLLEKINKGFGGRDEIGFYTDQILENGTALQKKREKMFEELNPVIFENGLVLNGKNTEVKVTYKKNEINHQRLQEYEQREIGAMTTLIGPHRDDFEIIFNGHNVSNFGSRGEQRSCVLALKIGEIEYIEKNKGDRPVLLLDDIFSELDDAHQKAVIESIEGKQTTITSTAASDFVDIENAKVINLPLK